MKTPPKITKFQCCKYWRHWGQARRALRRTLQPAEADARRHEIHVETLGTDKSHFDLTNRELDAVLAAFDAIARPADMNRQLSYAAQDRKRMLWKIASLSPSAAYTASITRQMFGKNGTDDLDAAQLRKVIAALTVAVKRKEAA